MDITTLGPGGKVAQLHVFQHALFSVGSRWLLCAFISVADDNLLECAPPFTASPEPLPPYRIAHAGIPQSGLVQPKFRGCPNGTEVDEKGEEMRHSDSAAG
jgi:hypothetical protein